MNKGISLACLVISNSNLESLFQVFWYNKIKRNLGESHARKTSATINLVTLLLFFSLD